MTTQYWLVKQEPESYAWSTFAQDGKTTWDGVRNYQARNHLRSMRVGDRVLFYASVGPKEVQGLARVTREAFPDPTDETGDWVTVELAAEKALPTPVTLEAIKAEPALTGIALLRQARLSVMPLRRTEFDLIVRLGSGVKKPSASGKPKRAR
ncbi:MAG TPA: EVE domain-containing protein [Candidatus Synoicihabitans sp.]|nr:EVE domain-containing protein [Candidatus Synoicihabitans sp.]